MELGTKIREARLAAGLSQRQLCGDRLTRNMLSQIETGSARPSMKTLAYLAQQLDKPVSFFLEEQTVTSPNRQCLEDGRIALALGDLDKLRAALDAYREPDPVFAQEYRLLEFLWHLRQGQLALESGRRPYGVKLLEKALEMEGLYITRELRYRVRVLLGLAGQPVELESDDGALLVRAGQSADPARQLEILDAAENREDPRWNLLRGEALLQLKRYAEAVQCYQKAQPSPQVYGKLELCCRELGDYKRAYEYACLQR